MEKTNINLEMMNAPSYKLLVTTPMAAIMSSGKSHSEWSGLLQSIAPVYASAGNGAGGEVKEALLTVSALLQGGDGFIRKYFEDDDLGFEKLMEASATGADIWMCKLTDNEIAKPEIIKLFKALQAGLIEAVGDLRDENPMINEMIQVQDKVIEHITSLN